MTGGIMAGGAASGAELVPAVALGTAGGAPFGEQAGGLAGAATLMAVGLLVVFVTLSVLALVIAGMRRLAPSRVAEAAPEPERPAGINRHHLVAISAAVAVAAGPRARVHRIVMLGREAGRQWVSEGRVVVMGSHRPRR
jgi:Na+-transporting methylmalonyl-CoA/oxaloacetate decarboxylase gamma subunit